MILTPSLIVDLALLALLGVIVLHSLRLWKKRWWLFCDPLNIFWVAALTCYVAQPVAFYEVFADWHGEELIAMTLAWVAFGFLFVILGYESPLGKRLGIALPATPARLNPNRFAISASVLIALGLAGYAYLMASAGGPEEWLSVSRGGTDLESISGYLGQLEHLLPLGVVLLLFHANMHSVSKIKKVAVGVAASLLMLFLIYLGSRSRVIYLALAILSAYYLPRRRNPPSWLLVGVFIVSFVAAQFIGVYRHNFSNLSFNLDRIDMAEARAIVLPSFLGGDPSAQYDLVPGGIEFNVVLSVIRLVPDIIQYNLGYGHLEIFTRPIPRALWPDKRYPHMESVQGVLRAANLTGSVVITSERELLAGPSFTFTGHWYYVGGPIGLIFGGLVTGILFRLIRTVYDRSPGSEGDVLLFASSMMIGFGEAVATPFLFLTSLPFQLGPLVVVLWLSRATTAKRATARRVPRPIARGG